MNQTELENTKDFMERNNMELTAREEFILASEKQRRAQERYHRANGTHPGREYRWASNGGYASKAHFRLYRGARIFPAFDMTGAKLPNSQASYWVIKCSG